MADPEHVYRLHRRDAWLLALLLVFAAVVLGRGLTVGGFRYGDSAAHAMDGVLIHDWVSAGPRAWLHPLEFAERQYAHYPALGIGRHYPPGFAIIEAGFFAVFGISVSTAKLCVLTFGLAAIAGTYLFIRRFADHYAALLGAAAMLTLPATTEWGRQVMLEVPTLAVAIGAALAYDAYLRFPTLGRLLLSLAVSALAVGFKQTAVFLWGAIAITTCVAAARRALPWRHAVGSVVAAIAAGSAVLLSLDGHASQLLRGLPVVPERWSVAALTYYLRALPSQTGWGILALAAIGVVGGRHKLGMRGVFLSAWLLACYGMVTIADYKNERHFFLGLFPIAVCSGLGLHVLLRCTPRWLPERISACTALLWLGTTGIASPIDDSVNYGPIVVANADRITGHAVLIAGLREGDFVFAVRQHVPWRRAVVLRGSKVLYTCNGRPDLDYAANVDSLGQLAELMRGLALRTLFVERAQKVQVRPEALLRRYLQGGDEYRRIASYPLPAATDERRRDATMDVYEPAAPMVRTVGRIELLIPRSQQRIALDLGEWS